MQVDDLNQPLVHLRYAKIESQQARKAYRNYTKYDFGMWVISGVIPAMLYGTCYAMGYDLTSKACSQYTCYTEILPEMWVCALLQMGWYWLIIRMGK